MLRNTRSCARQEETESVISESAIDLINISYSQEEEGERENGSTISNGECCKSCDVCVREKVFCVCVTVY